MKVVSAKTLIKNLDYSLADIGYDLIVKYFENLIYREYRKTITDLISKNKLGYYSLCNSLDKIAEASIKSINSSFGKGEVVVSQFTINSIQLNNNLKNTIEDQQFELRRKRLDIDEEIRYQEKSIELLKKKTEIFSKNPEYMGLMTEAEKDKALKRYLIKEGYLEFDKSHDKISRESRKQKDNSLSFDHTQKIEDSEIGTNDLKEEKSAAEVFSLVGLIFLA